METPEIKKLYKSRTNKVFWGICGGIGEYFNVDPVFVRLITLIVVICSGIVPGLIVYLISYFIIPEKPFL